MGSSALLDVTGGDVVHIGLHVQHTEDGSLVDAIAVGETTGEQAHTVDQLDYIAFVGLHDQDDSIGLDQRQGRPDGLGRGQVHDDGRVGRVVLTGSVNEHGDQVLPLEPFLFHLVGHLVVVGREKHIEAVFLLEGGLERLPPRAQVEVGAVRLAFQAQAGAQVVGYVEAHQQGADARLVEPVPEVDGQGGLAPATLVRVESEGAQPGHAEGTPPTLDGKLGRRDLLPPGPLGDGDVVDAIHQGGVVDRLDEGITHAR